MRVNSEAEMLVFGQEFAKNLTLPAVIELVGDVGMGKTTFTRGLASGLGIETPITSPSFTISKRYAFLIPQGTNQSSTGELIHYDFYRLDDPGIMRDEIAEALRDQNSVLVVEWGGDVADLLPETKNRLEFTLNDDGSREIQIAGPLAEMNFLKNQSSLWKSCGKLVEKSTEEVEKVSETVQKTDTTCANHAKNSVENSQSAQELQSAKKVQGELQPQSTRDSQEKSVKLYLDTSTDTCILRLNGREYQRVGKYDLAEKIFTFIHEKLQEQGFDWHDISEITFFSGPGSFTGLRIGAALVNTLAYELKIPLFDQHGKQHQIILPDYGREANISAPRK